MCAAAGQCAAAGHAKAGHELQLVSVLQLVALRLVASSSSSSDWSKGYQLELELQLIPFGCANRIFKTRTHVHISGRFGGTFPVQAFSIQKVVIKTSRVCLKHTFSANATSDACWTSIREDGCNGDAPSPAFHRQHRLQNARIRQAQK